MTPTLHDTRLHALDARARLRPAARRGAARRHVLPARLRRVAAGGLRRPARTLGITFFVIHVFRMTLFFVLAGFFARLLFHRRGVRAFIRDRATRIVVPLVVGLGGVLPDDGRHDGVGRRARPHAHAAAGGRDAAAAVSADAPLVPLRAGAVLRGDAGGSPGRRRAPRQWRRAAAAARRGWCAALATPARAAGARACRWRSRSWPSARGARRAASRRPTARSFRTCRPPWRSRRRSRSAGCSSASSSCCSRSSGGGRCIWRPPSV